MMRTVFISALLAASSLALQGQDVRKPDTQNFNVYDYMTYGGIVGYRVADYVTTENALAHGAVEGELPTALVESKPAFMAYSLGMAALEISGSAYLHRHGHKRLARIADTFSVGMGLRNDIKNARVQ